MQSSFELDQQKKDFNPFVHNTSLPLLLNLNEPMYFLARARLIFWRIFAISDFKKI
jgi:hypothetical protein